ncbi:response regulator transcription factor [Lentibacillus sp. Marseille-P4043]|uniref:response regulator transcription factor n=1 Tax=Lentibacillus sp. Marseille-P4043 TaxID=2040293 RepID=UPI000D0BA53C|nr:response regulator transcription factor [Lentibacillus sp. Marseille-P4043]
MNNIALIKEATILRDGIVSVLQERLSNYTIITYNSMNYPLLFQKEHMADLLIIDINTDIDLGKLLEYYAGNHKKVVIWTSTLENVQLADLFKLDLDGYFYNGMETTEILFAIETIMAGDQYIHPKLSPILLNSYVRLSHNKIERPIGILSEREWEVLEQIVQGNSNCNIGENLFISTTTVNNHVRSILKKLQVKDRTSAALLAVTNNWCVCNSSKTFHKSKLG